MSDISIIERNNEDSPLNIIPAYSYVQGKERIIQLALVYADTGFTTTNAPGTGGTSFLMTADVSKVTVGQIYTYTSGFDTEWLQVLGIGMAVNRITFARAINGTSINIPIGAVILKQEGVALGLSVGIEAIDDSFGGGAFLVSEECVSARNAGDTEWTPLGVLPLENLNPGASAEFDIRILVPALTLDGQPLSLDGGYQLCNLIIGGTIFDESAIAEYGTFAYGEKEYASTDESTTIGAVLKDVLMVIYMYGSEEAQFLEDAGIEFGT